MSFRSIALGACLVVCGATTAQVPHGWYVVSCFRDPANFRGDGGLFFVHPRNPQTFRSVSGLPASLTGAGTTSGEWGANCVMRRAEDEALIVGELATSGPISVHVLFLNGAAVDPARSTSFLVGQGGGAVQDVDLLPGGDILVAGRATTGPLAQNGLITISTAGQITPVPVTGFAGSISALGVDPSGRTAYLGTPSSPTGEIWSVPVPGGGAAGKIADVTGSVTSIDVMVNGDLLVGTFGASSYVGAAPNLFVVDPSSGTVSTIPVGRAVRNAVAEERATGNYAVVEGVWNYPFLIAGIAWVTPLGALQTLSWGGEQGWGVPSGIDINHNPETYGDPTPAGGREYRWQVAPNPGGLPLQGNAQFALRVQPGSGALDPGAWLASTRRAAPAVPVLGIELLVDPAAMVIGGLPLAANGEISLPIPVAAGLAGVELHVQTVHIVGSRLEASDGVSFTVL